MIVGVLEVDTASSSPPHRLVSRSEIHAISTIKYKLIYFMWKTRNYLLKLKIQQKIQNRMKSHCSRVIRNNSFLKYIMNGIHTTSSNA